MLGLLRFLAEG